MTVELYKALGREMKPGQWWTTNHNYPGYWFGSHGVVASVKNGARVLKPIRLGNYDGFQLKHADGNLVKRYRHRLIAEVFIGECPEGKECRHLDGDKTNNDISNLRWSTHKENNDDKAVHGTLVHGVKAWNAKLTPEIVLEMKRARETGQPFKSIATFYGVATMTAHRAITGETWRSVND